MTPAGTKKKAAPRPRKKAEVKKRKEMLPNTPGKSHRATGITFSEIAGVLQAGGDDERYNALMDELDSLTPSELIQAIIDEVVSQPNRAPVYVSCLIPDLQRMPTLPARILDRARQCALRSPVAHGLMFLYSSLFLAGYSMPKPWEQAMNELSIDLRAYERYAARLRKSFQEFFGGDPTARDAMVAVNLIDRIQGMRPITRATPINRTTGAFSARLEGKCPLEKYLSRIEAVNRNPLAHEHTFMAPSEARDLPNTVGTVQAKKYAVKVATLTEQGAFESVRRVITQLKEIEPMNALLSFIEAKTIQESLHEKSSSVEEHNVKLREQYAALEHAIDLAASFPNFYFFEDLALLLEIMGYFHAAYRLCLALLLIAPDDINLLLTVAFVSYQTSGPFKKYLLAAAMFDPVRTANFLDRFWMMDRFLALDRPQDYKISKEGLMQLEDDVDDAIDMLATEMEEEARARGEMMKEE